MSEQKQEQRQGQEHFGSSGASSEWIVGNMWTAKEEIGVSERDGPDLALLEEEAAKRDGPDLALLDEEEAKLRAKLRAGLWRAEWSDEYSMWYLWDTVTGHTLWDEWLYVNRGKGKMSFWWNSRTGVSSWNKPKDPTRRTCAVCQWQRLVATCSWACRRMALNHIAKLDREGIERLKSFEDNRDAEFQTMD